MYQSETNYHLYTIQCQCIVYINIIIISIHIIIIISIYRQGCSVFFCYFDQKKHGLFKYNVQFVLVILYKIIVK